MDKLIYKHAFRISSKSSLNASATEAIQNLRNFSLSSFSCCFAASASTWEGKNGGIAAVGGVGDWERGFRLAGSFVSTFSTAIWELVEEDAESEEDDEDSEERDSESEESELSSAGTALVMEGVGVVIFCCCSSAEDSEDESSDDEETLRRFRFRMRFRGGIW